MASYFGYNSKEWERAHMANAGDKDRFKNIKDATKNPEKYTSSMPHGGAKVAFQVDNYSGAGSGRRKGSPTVFYKVEEPKTVTKTVYKNKPAPKPAVPKEQSLKIEPVKHSLEIEQAKSRVQAYEKKDYSNIFKQDETDFTAKFNPSGKSDNSGGPQTDPQAFADKYKFEVAQSNKQFDTTSDQPMTSADILKKDKQQYGDYM